MDILGIEEQEESLYTFRDFPIKMGATGQNENEDLFWDLEFLIGKESGMIHVAQSVNPSILYSDSHYNNIGATWEQHHRAFAEFMYKYRPKSVFEIGGGTGVLSNCYKKLDDIPWTILESAPPINTQCKAVYEKGIFDENYEFKDKYDAIVHTHTMEHFLNPCGSISHIADAMPLGSWMFFSVPNLIAMYERNFTNVLNFEHSYLCAEPYITYMLNNCGYIVKEKRLFMEDHSVFYAAERAKCTVNADFNGMYNRNKNMFCNWINYHKEIIRNINDILDNLHQDRTIYLFGAHVYAQFLLGFGIKQDRISCVLDNDSTKQNMRLYGTRFMIKSPHEIEKDDYPVVILYAGVHNREISKQLVEINPRVRII